MSRNGVRTVYLKLEDGQIVKADSLEEVLEEHPEIKMVVLFWAWTEEFYTSNAGPFEAYVSPSYIDEEYSFFGDREDAIGFAQSYDCWDGYDFLLLPVPGGSILYCYHSDMDLQRSWNDGSDWVNGVREGYDPSWFPLLRVYYDYETCTEYLLSPDEIPKPKEAKE